MFTYYITIEFAINHTIMSNIAWKRAAGPTQYNTVPFTEGLYIEVTHRVILRPTGMDVECIGYIRGDPETSVKILPLTLALKEWCETQGMVCV